MLRTGQSHSGVFHFLPLGVRILEKLEHLIEKHMQSIGMFHHAIKFGQYQLIQVEGASKVSLSAITSEALWRKSGRLSDHSEVYMATLV